MQIQPIQEEAYLTARMTFDAMRMELLLSKKQIQDLQMENQKLRHQLSQKEPEVNNAAE